MSELLVKEKTENIVKKLSLNENLVNNRYFAEALCVENYENKSHNNRKLANVGDRFLKLVLAEEGYQICQTVEDINKFTNDNENDWYLAQLGLVKATDGYCMVTNDVPLENFKHDNGGKRSIKMIATLIEAIIGALYLEEFEHTGKSDTTRAFIKNKIIAKPLKYL